MSKSDIREFIEEEMPYTDIQGLVVFCLENIPEERRLESVKDILGGVDEYYLIGMIEERFEVSDFEGWLDFQGAKTKEGQVKALKVMLGLQPFSDNTQLKKHINELLNY